MGSGHGARHMGSGGKLMWGGRWNARGGGEDGMPPVAGKLIAESSYSVFLKSFYKSEFPHKFINVFLVLVKVKDKLTDLWGGRLL